MIVVVDGVFVDVMLHLVIIVVIFSVVLLNIITFTHELLID